ncbi:hypothetical protein BST96_09030 [Oceanicoccus sagamiensis]|uniref:DUF4136 domain-containing protein n=2 Tax=Oceanicoccus sagamiensis TaxID=716816 RepID=A0A1X9NFE3_9GAMM|nr:hypothetical protein BST96_09030 [Oceanicoccus sagamiensis]
MVIAVSLLAACGTTSDITGTWVEPSIKDKDLEGVLVVAVTEEREARVNFEDAYTQALKEKGVRAVASHTLVPGKLNKTKKEQVINAAKKSDLDTILVSHYAGTIEEPVFHQGRNYYDVVPAYGGYDYGRFGGYYGRVVKVGSSPDVWTSNKFVILVSDLYETATEEPLWQATSQTVNPDDRTELRNAIITAFVGQMEKQGLVK